MSGIFFGGDKEAIDGRGPIADVEAKVRILHIEDDRDFSNLVSKFLQRERDYFEVETENDSRDGLEHLREADVDCVVSDYDMPRLDGLDVLEQVRDEYPDLPFILFTGKGSEEIASKAISKGVTEYLQKGGGTEQYEVLANRIEQAVARYRAERQVTRGFHAIETAHDGISLLDEDGQFIYVNEAYADITGYDREELLGKHWDILYSGDELDTIYEEILPKAEESEWKGRTVYRQKDGSLVNIDHRLTYTTDDTLICTIADVSESEEADKEVSMKERAMDEAPIGITITDSSREDNPIIYANKGFVSLTGYSEEETLGRNCRFLQGVETQEEPRAKMREAIDNAEPVTVELRNYRNDGEMFWNRVSIAPILDDGGVPDYFVGFQQDVTKERRRERVLREMYDIISGRYQSLEEKIQALLELGRSELNTEYGSLSEIRGDEYVFKQVASDDDSIQSGDVVPVSATNCERVASTEETLVLGDIERDAPEQTDRAGFTEWGISCYLGAPVFIDHDVYGTFCFYGTESRSDQFSEWEVTLVDLMSRWASYELQRRQVNQQLQQTNDQLEQFSSVVSHDLRNPLSVAGGHLDLASEECDNEHLDAIRRALDRMDELISDLLVLAREGNSTTNLTSVTLATLSENCWQNVETADATLVTDVDYRIRADEGRLRQLFENLIRNAVVHGGDDVTVTVGELDDGFYIEDNGPGIPVDERDDVFDVGYSTQEDGTGFGLRIVEQIVEAHDWVINVTEGTEGGTRFEIIGVEFVTE